MERSRVGGLIAIGVGVALVGLGAAGLGGAGPLGSSAAAQPSARETPAALASTTPAASNALTSTPTTGSAAATTAVTAPAASPTASQLALATAFYAGLVPAVRAADAATLLPLLHPATIERYGEAACRAYLAGLNDPAFNLVVRAVQPPAPWTWERDGRTTVIPDAWAIDADVTSNGATARQEVHVAPVDGQVRWFTDCGTPLGTSPSP